MLSRYNDVRSVTIIFPSQKQEMRFNVGGEIGQSGIKVTAIIVNEIFVMEGGEPRVEVVAINTKEEYPTEKVWKSYPFSWCGLEQNL